MTPDTDTNDTDTEDSTDRAHAVCHDCEAEGILEADLAHHLAELHADAHGHNVEVQGVDR